MDAQVSVRRDMTYTEVPISEAIICLWMIVPVIMVLALLSTLYGQQFAPRSIPYRLHTMFRFDGEANLYAWISSTFLAATALLAYFEHKRHKHLGTGQATGWAVLAGGFLYLSADEAAMLHEKFEAPMDHLFNFTGFLGLAWVLVAATALIIVAVVLRPFLMRLAARQRLSYLLAGLLFVSGALGLEMVGAGAQSLYGENSAQFKAAMMLEEVFELLGVSIFLTLLLRQMRGFQIAGR